MTDPYLIVNVRIEIHLLYSPLNTKKVVIINLLQEYQVYFFIYILDVGMFTTFQLECTNG